MVIFRNNNRRPNFRRNDRSFKRNGDDSPKYKSNFSSNENFQRKIPGKNNHNASNLIEKYTDLARESLANEDKILSENYFQHAEHFTRVLNEQEKNRSIKSNIEQTQLVETNKKPIVNIENKKKEEEKIANS